MQKKTITFILFLSITLIIAFIIHTIVLTKNNILLFESKLILSYTVNYILALIILFFVENAIKKKSTNSGMYFILGSALKYIVFFFILFPVFMEDETLSKIEFAIFFVPYSLCLIIEVTYLSKRLNSQTF